MQPYGFEGADPVWTRREPDGVAAVHRTRVVRSWTDGEQIIRFGLHPSATPAAWQDFLDWRATHLAAPAEIPLPLLDPPVTWTLRLDPGRPGHALPADLDTLRAELPRRVHACARRALQLAEPGRYLAELLALPERPDEVAAAIAVLSAGADVPVGAARTGPASAPAADVVAYIGAVPVG